SGGRGAPPPGWGARPPPGRRRPWTERQPRRPAPGADPRAVCLAPRARRAAWGGGGGPPAPRGGTRGRGPGRGRAPGGGGPVLATPRTPSVPKSRAVIEPSSWRRLQGRPDLGWRNPQDSDAHRRRDVVRAQAGDEPSPRRVLHAHLGPEVFVPQPREDAPPPPDPHHDGIGADRGDLESSGNAGDVERDGVDRLAQVGRDHENPEGDGDDDGKQLERPVRAEPPDGQRTHAFSRTVSRRTSARSERGRAAACRRTPSSSFSRAWKRSGASPRSIWPSTAIDTAPVSSDTTTTTASVSSDSPRAARWRVPSVRASWRSRGRGRKHPAALIRAPWTMAAPACSGEPGWKIEPRSSAETTACIRTPSSV